jgi:broad specificity phosphatase PhoE
MKRVYLIRHALPDFPGGKGMCIGTTDIPLGGKGLMQAEEMAKILPAVAAVFSSPLTRAVQTAQAIGMPMMVLDDLREMYAGEWDGLTFEEIRQRYPELYAARANDLTISLPGAEDHEEALARFTSAMNQAATLSPGDFAVVAHGGIIAKYLQSLTGVWQKPDYVQVVPLLWEDGIFQLFSTEEFSDILYL